MHRIFLSYRRADDPFGAALLAAALVRRFGQEAVFLDTLALRPRADPDRAISRAMQTATLVVAFVGPHWDTGRNAARLHDRDDWVRRELVGYGRPVLPVFLGRRAGLAAGVPPELARLLADPVRVARDQLAAGLNDVVARIDGSRAPAIAIDDDLRTVGVDAMLRHVLPQSQQWSKNRDLIVRETVAALAPGDWLRHLATANLPRRPNGSALAVLTEEALTVTDLGRPGRAQRVPLTTVEGVDLVERRRLGLRPTADLLLQGPDLRLNGFFRQEAEELLEHLDAGAPPIRPAGAPARRA